MKVIKRDGRIIEFNKERIVNAILLAMERTEKSVNKDLANKISNNILNLNKDNISVEEIQDIVENKLMSSSRKDVAKEYITYRNQRKRERMKKTELYKIGQDIIDVKDLDMLHENANLNGESYSGKQSKFGSEYAKWYAMNFIVPIKAKNAVKNNYLHIHDLDHYAVGNHNCTFIPFGKLLKKGFSTGNGSVRHPNSIETAMQLVAIIFQSQQNCQFGGVAANMIDYDLAPYVDISFKKHFKRILREYNKFTNSNLETPENKDIYLSNENLKKDYKLIYDEAYKETKNSTHQGAESLIHNLNTMNSRSGKMIAV